MIFIYQSLHFLRYIEILISLRLSFYELLSRPELHLYVCPCFQQSVICLHSLIKAKQDLINLYVDTLQSVELTFD